MAYQHFYSRVPARISLYNKTDGFDTFAHSSELTNDFILKELSPVYENKLHKNDLDKIRRAELSPVFSQSFTRSGKAVQSALSYIPRDYTGERSAYLVHSLVLTDEERTKAFCDKNSFVFNPDMFVTDISVFNVTAQNAAPNRNYPSRQYITKPIGNIKKAVAGYNQEVVKSFLYAVILAACGKGKNVFFRLPCDDKKLSFEALNFINSVMAILPYSFRENLSFVTYVSDYMQYPSFKLKCVSSNCSEVPATKGVFVDFEANLVTGISADEVNANKPLTGFFYSLFENVEIRDKFHDYILRVTETYGSKAISLKMLSELVFLFWQCSGFYTERSVLPNDAMVYEFFGVFEKYRDALEEGYRSQAYKCLERYPKEHLPIPKNIFTKLQKVYPGELTRARRVALDVVLHLIHTDIMREKLFNFISTNYADELPEVKLVINEDLCRVFYGGFLQNDLLDFFDANFRSEPVKTQTIIVEKLLLAIRTEYIQEKIVNILSRHYDVLTRDLRLKIYLTFFEMLPECDALSALLIGLVNANIAGEGDDIKSAVASKIAEYLEVSYARQDYRLLPLLVEHGGFCDDVVIRLIFTRWNTAKIYSDYICLLAAGAAQNKAMKLIHIFKAVPEMKEEVYDKLLRDCKMSFGTNPWTTMYDLIEADRVGSEGLPPKFLAEFRELILYPAIIYTFYDVFKVRYGKDGINVLRTYAGTNPALTGSEQYKTVMEYVNLVECACSENTVGVFVSLAKLPPSLKIRRDISEHIRMCSLNKNTQSEKTAMLFELCINALKDSNFRFDAIFTQHRNSAAQRKNLSMGAKANPEKIAKESVLEALQLVLATASEICSAHSDYIDLVCSEDSGITKAMRNFLLNYGSGGAKLLINSLENSPEELRELAKYTVKESKPQNQGLFGRLFRK